MLSVLIPTYNYNVYPLAHEMQKQLQKTGENFEILIYDDASTINFDLKSLLRELPNVHYKFIQKNQGKVKTLHELASDATYEHLLIMDADVFPVDRFFSIKTLQTIQQTDADVYYGGSSVPAQLPSQDKSLRWRFGKERESYLLSERREKPYQTIVCQSLVIKKQSFLHIINKIIPVAHYYATDILFTYLLKKHQLKIYHYENKIIHLGLDNNLDFIEKTKASVNTYWYLYQQKLIDREHVKLIDFAEKYAPFGLCLMTKILNKIAGKLILKKLLSNNTNLFWLDVYKLIYYCSIRK